MESHLRAEIVPRLEPVTAREASQAAADLGQALQDLNAAKAAGGEADIKRADDAYQVARTAYDTGVKQAGWSARIGGAEFPIADFAVQADPETGKPMLSLMLAPDTIQIGEPAAPAPATPPAATPKVTSWGDGTHPDPRENIPGWEPERLGEQVAGHAEQRMVRWQPSDGQATLPRFVRLLRQNLSLATPAVTA